MDLRETLDLEIKRLGLTALRHDLAALEEQLCDLDREASELAGSISLWDRWMVLTDTPAEKQLKGSKRRHDDIEAARDELHARIAAANAALGVLCPPFAIATRLGDCLSLAYTGLDVEGWILRRIARGHDLRAALLDTIALVRRTYFPDLDFAALRDRLTDASACQRLAELADIPLPMDPVLGHAPLSGDAPLGRVAERLLGNGFFAAHYREEELGWRCLEQHGVARPDVGALDMWDRLKAFLGTWDWPPKTQAQKDQHAAQEALRRGVERQQRLLHAAMRAYPPLDLYHGLIEVLGIVDILRPESELVMSRRGAALKQPVVAPRALLLAAIRRLQDLFADTFPGVPIPRDLLDRSPDDTPHLRGTLASAELLARAAASPQLQALRDEALVHAGMVGQIGHEKAAVAARISLLDRLVFWSDTTDEKAAAALDKRADANIAWTRRLWQQILGEIQAIGAGIGPLAVRDLAVTALAGIDEIHTDRGSSSTPIHCTVHHQAEVLITLNRLRDLFAARYGVTGDIARLMQAVALADPAPHTVELDPLHVYAPIDPPTLHRLLAHHLAPTSFRDDHRTFAHKTDQLERALAERRAVLTEISTWDRLNVFVTTDAEARRDRLAATIADLRADLEPRRGSLSASVTEALRAYPPALLCIELDAVVAAVEAIRATCQTTTVTTGSGNNRRTETRYHCKLHGKHDAELAMQRWATLMIDIFGDQPGYHALLEALELGPAGAAFLDPQS